MYAHMYTHVPKLGGGLPCRQTGQKYMSGWTGRVRLGQTGAATPHYQQDYMFDWTVRRSRHVHTYMYMRSWHYIYMYMYRLHVHVHVAYMYMYRKRP